VNDNRAVTSLWLEQADAEAGRDAARTERANVRGERVDVAIVGAGVTGCACALALAERGASVAVYDARRVAGGASGRNGGFALRGAAPAYDEARERFGHERAAAIWRLSEHALDRMELLAGDALRRSGSLRLAADAEERAALQREHDALEADGFAAEWVDALPGRCAELFHGAIRHPGDGSLDPARWVRRLAAAATAQGATIVESSRVQSLAALGAERVLVATDGYTHGLVPELDAVIVPARGQVVATEPLAECLFDAPHYARHGYDYWQQLPDGRLVVGGWRDTALADETTREEAVTPAIQERIEAFIVQLLGRLPAITHRWSGIFGVTESKLPFVGPLRGNDHVWVAAGYSGHGNVLGLACGELVGRGLAGEDVAELELFERLG
jgi:glycine/D-amino acid oxidase-like deaminating enzyme